MFFVEKKDILSAFAYQLFQDLPNDLFFGDDLYKEVGVVKHVLGAISNKIDDLIKLMPEDSIGMCLDFPSFEDFVKHFLPIKELPEMLELQDIEYKTLSIDIQAKMQDRVSVDDIYIMAMEKINVFHNYLLKSRNG